MNPPEGPGPAFKPGAGGTELAGSFALGEIWLFGQSCKPCRLISFATKHDTGHDLQHRCTLIALDKVHCSTPIRFLCLQQEKDEQIYNTHWCILRHACTGLHSKVVQVQEATVVEVAALGSLRRATWVIVGCKIVVGSVEGKA